MAMRITFLILNYAAPIKNAQPGFTTPEGNRISKGISQGFRKYQ
jgi:hypothetical protein